MINIQKSSYEIDKDSQALYINKLNLPLEDTYNYKIIIELNK